MLVALNENLKILQEEKKDLQTKLDELKEKTTLNIQIIQKLEKSLNMAQDELNKFNENQLSKMAEHDLKTQLSADAFTREKDILKFKLNEKQKELEFCEAAKIQMNISHTNEISRLEQQLQAEKLKLIKKRYCLTRSRLLNTTIDIIYLVLDLNVDKSLSPPPRHFLLFFFQTEVFERIKNANVQLYVHRCF